MLLATASNGRLGGSVDDQVAQAGVAVLADGHVQAHRVGVVAEQLGDAGLGGPEGLGQLGQGRRPPEPDFHLGLQPAGPPDLVADVGGDPHGVGGVLHGPADRLPDPPGGVGGELEALAPVELLDGVDQAEVALLDEIAEGQTRPLVLPGHGNDQPQVGVDELGGGVGGGGDLLPQLPALLGRQLARPRPASAWAAWPS